MRETSARYLFVAVVSWVSLSLIIASWLPSLGGELRELWMITGATGLVSAVGLAELIKSDQRAQDRLLHEYMQAASMDGLTGLANRPALDKALSKAMANFDSRRNPLTIMMFDVDHFKQVNDQYGHQAGDEVLRFLANNAVEFFQGQACVARYGGEEFAVIFPGFKLKEAFLTTEDFRKKVERLFCRFRDQHIAITISAGVTEARNGESFEEVIRRADLGLYTAKKMGRNCVWFGESATDMVSESHPDLDILQV